MDCDEVIVNVLNGWDGIFERREMMRMELVVCGDVVLCKIRLKSLSFGGVMNCGVGGRGEFWGVNVVVEIGVCFGDFLGMDGMIGVFGWDEMRWDIWE